MSLIYCIASFQMASSNITDINDEHKSWEAPKDIHDLHQWDDSTDDDLDDNHQFFDACDTDFQQNQSSSSQTNTEANLLHERLNEQCTINESEVKKLPGKIIICHDSITSFYITDLSFRRSVFYR